MGFQKGSNPQQNVHRQVAEEDPFLDLDVLQVDEETQDFCTQFKLDDACTAEELV